MGEVGMEAGVEEDERKLAVAGAVGSMATAGRRTNVASGVQLRDVEVVEEGFVSRSLGCDTLKVSRVAMLCVRDVEADIGDLGDVGTDSKCDCPSVLGLADVERAGKVADGSAEELTRGCVVSAREKAKWLVCRDVSDAGNIV